MVCESCRDKLARRLTANHKIDLIRAYEIAEKGLERHQINEALSNSQADSAIHSLTDAEKAALTFDPDYSKTCVGSVVCSSSGNSCTGVGDCPNVTPCPHICLAPLANSHLVSDDCVYSEPTHCTCISLHCVFGQCIQIGGACYYACDTGYVWNGSACVLPAPTVTARGDGLVWIVAMAKLRNAYKSRFPPLVTRQL